MNLKILETLDFLLLLLMVTNMAYSATPQLELIRFYITANTLTFRGVIISRALPLPFGYLITVPSTADKWYFQL